MKKFQFNYSTQGPRIYKTALIEAKSKEDAWREFDDRTEMSDHLIGVEVEDVFDMGEVPDPNQMSFELIPA